MYKMLCKVFISILTELIVQDIFEKHYLAYYITTIKGSAIKFKVIVIRHYVFFRYKIQAKFNMHYNNSIIFCFKIYTHAI